jgi:hypothetical protein
LNSEEKGQEELYKEGKKKRKKQKEDKVEQ